jgi:hypothetical protein
MVKNTDRSCCGQGRKKSISGVHALGIRRHSSPTSVIVVVGFKKWCKIEWFVSGSLNF